MDYHLQNLRTGASHSVIPERTLIGTADHATVRTAAGPFLAALVVRYPGGWAIHGLSDDPGVTFANAPLQVTQQAVVRPNAVLRVGSERFRFVPSHKLAETPSDEAEPPPTCYAYVLDPDGVEECRAVDHDLLFGRLPVCHVRFPDKRLSRVHALLAAHGGVWYLHPLSKNPVARNREVVTDFVRIEDEDELLIGPLVVRLELRTAPTDAPPPGHFVPLDDPAHAPATTDELAGTTVETPSPVGPDTPPDLTSLRAAGVRLDQWLKAQRPAPTPAQGGIGGWLGAQRARLGRFWYDTPETTTARALRTGGRFEDAFAILDRAIRARPESPELLRELYRLYDAAGLTELTYRPLRQIELLAETHGRPDTWVLETLARVCERLGRDRPSMYDRAVSYWRKLEAATGVSYARERDAVMANRTLREGGFAGGTPENG
jgi:hypothetical protein